MNPAPLFYKSHVTYPNKQRQSFQDLDTQQ